MVIEPKVKGFICTTAHPVGCKRNVQSQISYVKKQGVIAGAKKVLVIGSSTGYGLASRITAAFGMGAATMVSILISRQVENVLRPRAIIIHRLLMKRRVRLDFMRSQLMEMHFLLR